MYLYVFFYAFKPSKFNLIKILIAFLYNELSKNENLYQTVIIVVFIIFVNLSKIENGRSKLIMRKAVYIILSKLPIFDG